MPDDRNDHPTESEAGETHTAPTQVGVVHVTGGNVYQAGSGSRIYFNLERHSTESKSEDPRQAFLTDVRTLALKDASRSSVLSLVFLTAGATILLSGGVLALMRHGTSAGPTAPLMTSLAGVLIGTSGGALALQSMRAQRRLAAEADRVADELSKDHTREEALALIDRVTDPALKDRLMSVTAMKVMGLTPAPDNVARHVFPVPDAELPAIAPVPHEEG